MAAAIRSANSRNHVTKLAQRKKWLMRLAQRLNEHAQVRADTPAVRSSSARDVTFAPLASCLQLVGLPFCACSSEVRRAPVRWQALTTDMPSATEAPTRIASVASTSPRAAIIASASISPEKDGSIPGSPSKLPQRPAPMSHTAHEAPRPHPQCPEDGHEFTTALRRTALQNRTTCVVRKHI